jgi:acetyl-CoA carboxylase carboxyl transferase subunit alpha
MNLSKEELVEERYLKYKKIGQFAAENDAITIK